MMIKSPKVRSILAVASLLVLPGLTAPAMAKSSDSDEQKPTVKVEKRDDGKTYYCVAQPLTGSLLPQQTCRTKEDWAERGVTFGETKDPAASADKDRKAGGKS